uniref:Tyrosinase n=1 Tax=Hypsizygus marmoreus TaxID=39966 RepID=A0A0A7DL33_HYPMA|nr:tyrosinase [Hypsizygus marmoreus]
MLTGISAFVFTILAVLPLASNVFGAPAEIPPCTVIHQRKEWRSLCSAQRRHYINAVYCLQRLPAVPAFPGAKTRYDDFQALHINLSDGVHTVGQFLPWHRRFLGVYVPALRVQCGYYGGNPYWDFTKDIGDAVRFVRSPLFVPSTGFGGTGVGEDGIVVDGPFAYMYLSFGIGPTSGYHFLTRVFDFTMFQYLSPDYFGYVMEQLTFEAFRIVLEGVPITESPKVHDAGHRLIGGDMGDTYSGPGDPLFYVHHANLDRIWWNWQTAAPSRLFDISGRSTVDPPYQNVSLVFPLEMGVLAPLLPIRKVMDILHGDSLCYQYV